MPFMTGGAEEKHARLYVMVMMVFVICAILQLHIRYFVKMVCTILICSYDS